MIVTYEAINRSGDIVHGTLAVQDMPQAQGELNRSGLIPVRVSQSDTRKTSSSGKTAALLPRWRRNKTGNARSASRRELPFFTEQMSILLETGTPLAASLSAIERQATCPHWRLLVTDLRHRVEEGNSLAAAVAAYPEIFDPIYHSMIAAGEASGNLPAILSRLAQLSRLSDRIRRKVISAMIYPALLTGIAGTAMIVLIFFVLPRFTDVFEQMNVSLPATTRTLLAISNGVRQHFLPAIIAAALIVMSIGLWWRSYPGRRFVARNILRVPIAGPLICSVINARLFRLIGLLIESSVGLLESLELTICATKNYLYVQLLTSMRDNVINGRPMYEALLKSSLIPAGIAQMVHTGEENAQVGRIMSMLADYLEDRNETQIGTLTSIMEPVILIFMGLIVGTVAISLVLPMFDLSRIS